LFLTESKLMQAKPRNPERMQKWTYFCWVGNSG